MSKRWILRHSEDEAGLLKVIKKDSFRLHLFEIKEEKFLRFLFNVKEEQRHFRQFFEIMGENGEWKFRKQNRLWFA